MVLKPSYSIAFQILQLLADRILLVIIYGSCLYEYVALVPLRIFNQYDLFHASQIYQTIRTSNLKGRKKQIKGCWYCKETMSKFLTIVYCWCGDRKFYATAKKNFGYLMMLCSLHWHVGADLEILFFPTYDYCPEAWG